MGCWLGAKGRLTVKPDPDDKLIREYVYFSNNTCPKWYSEDEIFCNSWFFDSQNKLISDIGKFAEPEVWYNHLKENFFEPRGYELIGDPEIVGECDVDIWKLGDERGLEYKQWCDRVKHIFSESL